MLSFLKKMLGIRKPVTIDGGGSIEFSYRAHCRRTNQSVDGIVSANNQGEAITLIKKEGYLPIEVREIK